MKLDSPKRKFNSHECNITWHQIGHESINQSIDQWDQMNWKHAVGVYYWNEIMPIQECCDVLLYVLAQLVWQPVFLLGDGCRLLKGLGSNLGGA